jgi:predicted RNA-binding Zn-ribbon protein involved in translation (DUF1610 family)
MKYFDVLRAQFIVENGFAPSDESELIEFLESDDADAAQCTGCTEWIPLNDFVKTEELETDTSTFRCPLCGALESIWVYGEKVYPK